VIDGLAQTFVRYGHRKHLITDQDAIFTSGAFRELLQQWSIRHRLGAIGKHSSIAVTERVIRP